MLDRQEQGLVVRGEYRPAKLGSDRGAEEHPRIAPERSIGLDSVEAIGGFGFAPAFALIGADPESALTIDGAVVRRGEPAIR